jgi:glycerol kinase
MPRPATATTTPVVLAVDAGTTGVRALAVGPSGRPLASSYRALTQHFPRPGWVEHDLGEIWTLVREVLTEVATRVEEAGGTIVALGVTNQRETACAFDRASGEPLARAVVWQDRRTARRCRELAEAGQESLVRARTGLTLDPYFSATKFAYLLETGAVDARPSLALGTVDTWVVFNLTGGGRRGLVATDPSNASRTLLYDIEALRFCEELAELFGVPLEALPEVRPSSSGFGRVDREALGGALAGVPIRAVAGDQQAALFGQGCIEPGMAKATHGTGSFVLMNVGDVPPDPPPGLLATVAWQLGDSRSGAATGDVSEERGTGATAPIVAYALEGSMFATGSAIQWLRDGLGLLADATELEPLARRVPDSGGLVLVPAFAGLGSPWWDATARGAIVGVERGADRARLARALVEAIAFETRDVVEAMVAAAGRPLVALRVDGGVSAMDLLLELEADQLGVPVERSAIRETTALGAAFLAGLAEGVWSSPAEVAARWSADRRAEPGTTRLGADARHRAWRAALERARGWARS